MSEVTLVTVGDLYTMFRIHRQTAAGWRSRGWLGPPAANVSSTDVYVYEWIIDPLLKELRSNGFAEYREPDARLLAQTRERASVETPVVPSGIKEISVLLGIGRRQFSTLYRRGKLPTPIALLNPKVWPDGRPAQQIPVWDVSQYSRRETYNPHVGAALRKRNAIGSSRVVAESAASVASA